MYQHVHKHGHKVVVPTVRMLRYWWARINLEVFGGCLLPCQLSLEDCSGYGAVGLCYPLDGGRVRIVVDPCNSTRAGMLGTLAHEMVHQYQHQNGQPMRHGESFQLWSDPIHGLTGLHI